MTSMSERLREVSSEDEDDNEEKRNTQSKHRRQDQEFGTSAEKTAVGESKELTAGHEEFVAGKSGLCVIGEHDAIDS